MARLIYASNMSLDGQFDNGVVRLRYRVV